MTVYRLYLRSCIRREFLPPGDMRFAPESFASSPPGQQEQPTMIFDHCRYSYVITGCEEFEAENDAAALMIARLIYDASGDLCDAFELWDGTRHIDQTRMVLLESGAISAIRQEEVVRTEEALLSSQWVVAHSRRLLARFDEMHNRSATALPAVDPVTPG